MPRKDFVEALRAVASKHSLDFKALSHNWIIQIRDPVSGRLCSVFGYTFDINPAGAVDICREKAATSLVLDECGVPNVPHKVFLSPSWALSADYVPRSGIWAPIQSLVEELGFPVVLKPLKGTGGLDVMKVSCWREVEAAVHCLHSKEHGLAISPFKKIIDEYRCVCLDGTVELIYRKVRSQVRGNGALSVGALVAREMGNASDPKELSGLARAASEWSPEDLARVPGQGEAVPVQWKHNLGQGASADMDVPDTIRQQLVALAKKATEAIGIRFCSVDIVEVDPDGFMIMEVNGGVMMDSLMGQMGESGTTLAQRLYEAAVLRALGR